MTNSLIRLNKLELAKYINIRLILLQLLIGESPVGHSEKWFILGVNRNESSWGCWTTCNPIKPRQCTQPALVSEGTPFLCSAVTDVGQQQLQILRAVSKEVPLSTTCTMQAPRRTRTALGAWRKKHSSSWSKEGTWYRHQVWPDQPFKLHGSGLGKCLCTRVWAESPIYLKFCRSEIPGSGGLEGPERGLFSSSGQEKVLSSGTLAGQSRRQELNKNSQRTGFLFISYFLEEIINQINTLGCISILGS